MKQKNFSIRDRIKSFKYAFEGLRVLIREEHNARIHLSLTICVLVAGFISKLTSTEWILLVLVIGFVFIAEILNSAIENLADFVSPAKHQLIKKVKDLTAAAVLISALVAVIVGAIIFVPKILAIF